MAFNLSKNNDPVPVKNNHLWILILLVVVIIGVGIWYFTPKKEEVVPGDRVVATQVADTAVVPPVIASSRVAASFNKGTSAPVSISDEVVNEIKKAHKITLYGYASSEGDISVNIKLAQERAESFKQYLISKGLDAGMITAIGKGIDNPVATNDTESGRTQNRRVEVSIE